MSKPTFANKPKYTNVKKFKNDELYKIVTTTKDWMSFDTATETANPKMKKRGIRYLQVMVKDLEGKRRPFSRETTPATLKSRCRPAEGDDEDAEAGDKSKKEITGSFKFSTRIEICDKIGTLVKKEAAQKALFYDDSRDDWKKLTDKYKLTVENDDIKVTQEYIDARINSLAFDKVSKHFPDIPDDEFENEVKKQEMLIKNQYTQGIIELAISNEFERLLNTRQERDKIGYEKKASDVINGNVQVTREAKNDDNDREYYDKEQRVPLDEFMVYYKLGVDKKNGDLWCKIEQKLQGKPKEPVMISRKEIDNGKEIIKKHKVNFHTLEEWFRYGSVYTGICNYQMCITPKGPRLHATMKEMVIKRAAKSAFQGNIDKESVEALDSFGGNFAEDESEEELENNETNNTEQKFNMSKLAAEAQSIDDMDNDDD